MPRKYWVDEKLDRRMKRLGVEKYVVDEHGEVEDCFDGPCVPAGALRIFCP